MLAVFAHKGATRVTRYVLPKLPAMNFVIDDALEGGVNGSLCLDGHGKALSFLVLGDITRAGAAGVHSCALCLSGLLDLGLELCTGDPLSLALGLGVSLCGEQFQRPVAAIRRWAIASSESRWRRHLTDAAVCVVVGAAYFALAWLSTHLTPRTGDIAYLWPAGGFILGLLVVAPKRLWLPFALSALAGDVAHAQTVSPSLGMSVAYSTRRIFPFFCWHRLCCGAGPACRCA